MHRMFSVGRERGSAPRETVGEGRSAAPLDIRLRVLGDRSVREKVWRKGCVMEGLSIEAGVERVFAVSRLSAEKSQTRRLSQAQRRRRGRLACKFKGYCSYWPIEYPCVHLKQLLQGVTSYFSK